jgi:16S rRNA (cytosine967-C5)-methyltransferase
VSAFLSADPDFKLVHADTALPEKLRGKGLVDAHGFLRLWPHRHGTEGFFAAVLERER